MLMLTKTKICSVQNFLRRKHWSSVCPTCCFSNICNKLPNFYTDWIIRLLFTWKQQKLTYQICTVYIPNKSLIVTLQFDVPKENKCQIWNQRTIVV